MGQEGKMEAIVYVITLQTGAYTVSLVDPYNALKIIVDQNQTGKGEERPELVSSLRIINTSRVNK